MYLSPDLKSPALRWAGRSQRFWSKLHKGDTASAEVRSTVATAESVAKAGLLGDKAQERKSGEDARRTVEVGTEEASGRKESGQRGLLC